MIRQRVKRMILVIILLLACVNAAFSQTHTNYTSFYNDSLITDGNSDFVYNTVHIANLSQAALPIQVTLITPTTWNLLSAQSIEDTIHRGDTLTIPITLLKKKESQGAWVPIKLYLKFNEFSNPDTIQFYVRSQPQSGFTVEAGAAISTSARRTIETSVHIKNAGNVPGKYYIHVNNIPLSMDYQKAILLKAGKDTNALYFYTVPKAMWASFNSEEIHCQVIDSMFIMQELSKPRKARETLFERQTNTAREYDAVLKIERQDSVIKDHKSAFPILALDLEGGYISYYSRATYFGALAGSIPVGAASKVSFDYHSRQFGLNNIIASDIYNVYFASPHWGIHVGQVSDGQFFRTFGTGLSVGYNWGKQSLHDNSLTIFGVKHTAGFYADNDNGGISARLKLGKVRWLQSAFVNTDSNKKYNSYIYTTEFALLSTANLDVAINGGIGLVENKLQNKTAKHTQGEIAGYHFRYTKGIFSLSSSLNYFSKSFPGFNSGAVNSNQSIRFRFKRVSIEGFYNYDLRTNNYFIDTLYNTDVLSTNVTKYGLRINGRIMRSFVSVGGGYIQQTSENSYYFTPKYLFAELSYNYRSLKSFAVTLNSVSGYAAIGDKTGIISSTSLNLSSKFVGLSGGYSRVPVINNDLGEQTITSNTETINGGPYITFKALKHLVVSCQYNYSKTLYDRIAYSFLGLSLNYDNARMGLRMNVNGSIPLSKLDESSLNPLKNGFLTASIKKSLNVPFVAHRKYYTLNARLYKDNNNNSIFDENDEVFHQMPLDIQGKHFITNTNGVVKYKNLSKGAYNVQLSTANAEGYLPNNGYSEDVTLKNNTYIDIPFNKGSIISGQVRVIEDTANANTFSLAKIKVSATDTSKHNYSALTDSKGNYNLTLPAGKYIVSLNPDAFNDQYRPYPLSVAITTRTKGIDTANFVIKQHKRKMQILQTNTEVVAKPSKAKVQVAGYVPMSKEQFEIARKAEAETQGKPFVPLEKDSTALRYYETHFKLKAQPKRVK